MTTITLEDCWNMYGLWIATKDVYSHGELLTEGLRNLHEKGLNVDLVLLSQQQQQREHEMNDAYKAYCRALIRYDMTHDVILELYKSIITNAETGKIYHVRDIQALFNMNRQMYLRTYEDTHDEDEEQTTDIPVTQEMIDEWTREETHGEKTQESEHR